MEESIDKSQSVTDLTKIKTFPVQIPFKDIKENIAININTINEPSKEQVINQAIIFHLQGNIKEASNYYEYCLENNLIDHRVLSNYGVILKDHGNLKKAEFLTRKSIQIKPDFVNSYLNLGIILNDLGNLKEAELYTRKAIKLKPDLAEAHSNLGTILNDLGNLKEAEVYLRKAIEINPRLAKANFALSILNPSSYKKRWQEQLFSESILKNQRKKDLIDIYFARANILDANSNFSKASYFLEKGNNLNRDLYGSDYSYIRKKMESFDQFRQETKNNLNQTSNIPIFIVGLPRSGKTMTESILSCNDKLIKCGENLALEKSIEIYLEAKNNTLNLSLNDLYFDQLKLNNIYKSFICTTTPMNLIYTKLILSQIPKAKIIYCYRNPLDSIKEIYKKHMENKNTYSCSIVESANLYIEVYYLMRKYKKMFDSKIYFLNYDKLVTNSKEEIKELLRWLEWSNDSKYLEPNLDPTTIKTSRALNSKIINKDELYSWKNYHELLKPAIKIFKNSKQFNKLIQ